MAQLLERAELSLALAEHREAVLLPLSGSRQAEGRIRAAGLPCAVVWGRQQLRRSTWTAYAAATPEDGLRPLWNLLRDLPGAAYGRKGRAPAVRVGERLWELAVEEYQTDQSVFLPSRFALSCTLHFHADNRKLVVSNLARAFPAGSLSIDLIRYEPSVRVPVVRDICFAVVTHPELAHFRSLCQLDPKVWEPGATHQALQDELFFRVRDLEEEGAIHQAVAAAIPDWEAGAKIVAERRTTGWFSRALAEGERQKRR